jgi:hypothetical protein
METEGGDLTTKSPLGFSVSDFRNGDERKPGTSTGGLIHEDLIVFRKPKHWRMVNDPLAIFDGVLNRFVSSVELSIGKIKPVKNNNLMIDDGVVWSPLFNCSGAFVMGAPVHQVAFIGCFAKILHWTLRV